MTTRYQGSTMISSAILVLVVTILTGLGFWQLSRMQDKQTFLADIEDKKSQPARALIDVIDTNKAADNVVVEVSGKLEKQWVWLVDNRQMKGQIGYQVIVPVQTAAGSILLDYGWIPSTGNRSIWPQVALPASISYEKGVITSPGYNPFVNTQMFEIQQADSSSLLRIQGIDIDQQQQQSGLTLLPFIVTLTDPDSEFVRKWQPVVMPPQKHMAYAIQWFGLAIAAFIIGAIVISKAGKQYDRNE